MHLVFEAQFPNLMFLVCDSTFGVSDTDVPSFRSLVSEPNLLVPEPDADFV